MASLLDQSVNIGRVQHAVLERYLSAERLLREAERQLEVLADFMDDDKLDGILEKIRRDADRLKGHGAAVDRGLGRRAEIMAAKGYREQEDLIKRGVLIKRDGVTFFAPGICFVHEVPAFGTPCKREACPKWEECSVSCPRHFSGTAAEGSQ